MMNTFIKILIPCILMSLGALLACTPDTWKNQYVGKSFSNTDTTIDPQGIPGKVQFEYFDTGGEGIAYHDTDSINRGSGRLNKGPGYLDTYRINDAVDLSYTKYHDSIDNSQYNFVKPEEFQLYVGWTEPGEWINYTIQVAKSGTYQVGMMYTSNGNGKVSISINNKDVTGPIDIESTYDAADPIGWRQWHHWNYLDGIAEVALDQGEQVLTFHTVTNGQMNYDFLSFTEKN